jgi:hypothetical protein
MGYAGYAPGHSVQELTEVLLLLAVQLYLLSSSLSLSFFLLFSLSFVVSRKIGLLASSLLETTRTHSSDAHDEYHHYHHH